MKVTNKELAKMARELIGPFEQLTASFQRMGKAVAGALETLKKFAEEHPELMERDGPDA